MQKLSIGETLSTGYRLSKANFSKLFYVFLFIYLGIDIASLFLKLNTSSSAEGLVVLWIMFLYGEYKTRTKGVNSDLGKQTSSFLWPVILTNIIQDLFLLGLLLLFIIPGVIYGIYWLFSTFVVMDNGVSGRKALSLSKSIIKGNWWRMFLIGILLLLSNVIAMIPVLYFGGIIPVVVTSILQTVAIYYSINVLLACYLRLSVAPMPNSANSLPVSSAVPVAPNINAV